MWLITHCYLAMLVCENVLHHYIKKVIKIGVVIV